MKGKLSPFLVILNLDKDAALLSDLLARFDNYGNAVAKTSGLPNSGLNILTRKSKRLHDIDDISIYRNIDITSVDGNIFQFIIGLHRTLKNELSNISIVIAGDPWLGFVICKLASFGLGLGIQVSIHGDPYQKSNYLGSCRAFLKDVWLRCFLRFADSVRLVSTHQAEQVKNRYHVNTNVISVCPIPVSIPKSIPERRINNKTIAFVGRLHKERGIETWIEIIKRVSKIRNDFNVLVIGDGPERNTFEQALMRLEIQMEFLGKLKNSKVQELWPKISILLSTASSESYGLALREAQLSGTYVVALKNEGTLENKRIFPMQITLFESVESAALVIAERLDSPFSWENANEIRRTQLKLNEESLAILVKSWGIVKK